jgi:hypothetical protein
MRNRDDLTGEKFTTPPTNADDHAARASEHPGDEPGPANFEDPDYCRMPVVQARDIRL